MTSIFLFLFELYFTLLRVKALVLTVTLRRMITILIVVSERVAIDILVQTGIHLFTFFESFEKKRYQLAGAVGSVLQGQRNSVKSTYALLDDDRDL